MSPKVLYAIAAIAFSLALVAAPPAGAQDRKDPTPIPTLKPDTGKWLLGVVTAETSRGCRVVSVKKGSPADKIGLEEGDYIIEVNGKQVGNIDGVIFSVASELRHSDQKAKLGIWDWRTRRVVEKEVELAEKK